MIGQRLRGMSKDDGTRRVSGEAHGVEGLGGERLIARAIAFRAAGGQPYSARSDACGHSGENGVLTRANDTRAAAYLDIRYCEVITMTRKTYNSATLRGKHRVCRYLSADDELRELVPRTVRFTRKGLLKMSERNTALYIKPDVGSLGMGIFKVSLHENGCELLSTIRRKQSRKTFDSIETAYGYMKAKAGGPMIVQAAVDLDTVEGSPYDLRVMVQRKPGGKWTVTGKFAKIGVRGKIVTNYAQGGRLATLPELWHRKGLCDSEGSRRSELLERKALGIARLLSGKRAGMREMGVDFAFDRSGHLWVLEVNSNHPQFHPLRSVDRRAYRRMKRFAASYGRLSSK